MQVCVQEVASPGQRLVLYKSSPLRSPAGYMAQACNSGILKWVEIEDGLDHHSIQHEPVMNFDMDGCLAAPISSTSMIPGGSVNGLICISQRGAKLTDGEYKVLRLFQGDLSSHPHISGRPSLLDEAEVYTLVAPEDAAGSIFTFDLDKETFQLFPSPPTEPGAMPKNRGNLGVLKGCLCKLDIYAFQLKIWVMKQYGIKESWYKELVITQPICDPQDWAMKKIMSVSLVVKAWALHSGEPKFKPWGTHSGGIVELEIFSNFLLFGLYSKSICQKIMPPINSAVENLPLDVTVDILSRLPVKTIIHCKCVCKKWHNLVNDSYFINLHFSRSPSGFMAHHVTLDGSISGMLKWVEIGDGLDRHSLRHEPAINFDLNGCLAAQVPSNESIPVGSINGLICIWHPGVDNVYVCNPITREYLTLPRSQNNEDGCGVIDYKFGVNSLTGEYKVLRIFRVDFPPYPYVSGRPSLLEAEVYTLGTSQWRSLGQVPYRFGGFRGTFLNSYFHWEIYHEDAPGSIFTFDLDKETFQLFPSPPTEPGAMQKSTGNLGVLKGCLCRLDIYAFDLEIWVMKQYGIKESWHKELVIAHPFCAPQDWEMKKFMYVFEGFQDGTILVVVGGKMLEYLPEINFFEDFSLLNNCFVRMTHRPSFIKLKDIDSERVHAIKR
ncbi:hypothetical protein OSB04_015985 [Centaurea solstitialis]|uniref:F-box domain-containing protein n=1 Tax=Centaurea solstitialis TaxID=347529 RepID=A0AA38T022_9ASTR|nr:hypothetical protein OSB04_015985 [Centaurea solstitialis]